MTELAATTPAPATRRAGKALHIALWSVQVLLGVMFALAGLMKATAPFAELTQRMPWTEVVGQGMTRFIGVSEFLGGIGLILPGLTRVRPVLTAWAAVGLVAVMVLAAGYHVIQGEFQLLPVNFVLGGLAAFVAWGRFKRAPIEPRRRNP